jgi:hypothetical protein
MKGIEPPKAEDGPFTIEEYIENLKANRPDLADIWSELWDIEIIHSIKKDSDGKIIDRMPEKVEKLLKDSLFAYVPVEIKIQIPILSFHVLGEARLPDYLSEEQKKLSGQFDKDVRLPFRKRLIAEFHNRFPYAKIVVIPDGHHYCFIAQEELVYDEMRKFLLE